LLDGEDLQSYLHIYARFEQLVCPPSVLVHVDADLDVLMKRIRDRGRYFELGTRRNFVRELQERHFDIKSPAGCSMFKYDTTGAEAGDENRYTKLLEEIKAVL